MSILISPLKPRIVKRLCLMFLFVFPVTAFAGVPADISSAFRKLYPKVSDPDWTLKGDYFVAAFTSDGFAKEAWMDPKGNWIMTQTDLQTMDEVPPAVYNAYAFGPYSGAQVNDVKLCEFPRCPSVIVVKVGEYNMDVYYDLFFSLHGQLLTTYTSNDLAGTLWPQVFNCP